MKLRKVDHLFSVRKVRNRPLPPLLVPLRVIYDRFKLVLTHQDTDNCLELFNLFLLVPYSIQ